MSVFEIQDGRKFLYQWDLNRILIVNDPTITQAHFCLESDKETLTMEVYDSTNNERWVNIPNILLQHSGSFKVYAYRIDHTITSAYFDIVPRAKFR